MAKAIQTPANVPLSVTVTFPKVVDGVSGGVQEIVVPLAGLALPEYSGNVGHIGTHQIRSGAVASFTGAVFSNEAELTTLAERITTDFYLWRLASLEINYEGSPLWISDALHDVEWHHLNKISTHVHVSTWQPDMSDSQRQSGTGGSGSGDTFYNLRVINNLTVEGDTTLVDVDVTNVDVTNITIKNGGTIKTTTVNNNTLLIQAYDVDAAAYFTFITLTASNTPTLNITGSSTNILTITNATIITTPSTPAQLTSSQNNYDPGTSDNVVIYSDAAWSLTGLAGGTVGRERWLFNIGNYPITLPHESGSSTAGNRFGTPTETDFVLEPRQGVPLRYQNNAAGNPRWSIPNFAGVAQTRSTASTISSDQNNYALPFNGSGTINTPVTGTRNLTGIAGGYAGRRIQLLVSDSGTLVLKHNSGSSSAGNKIWIATGADLQLTLGFSVWLIYSGSYWYVELPSAGAAGGSGIGYALISKQVYTANDTWLIGDADAILVEVLAGGGGGGGVDGQGAGTSAAGGGGGGGGYSRKWIVNPDASVTVTVGSGGSGGAAGANDGSAGGTSSFADSSGTVSATGGAGGMGMTADTSGNGLGGAGGGSSGGDINISGSAGTNGRWFSGEIINRSQGGSSFYGGAPTSTQTSTSAGVAASVYGGGGSGATNTDTATNYAGGNGAAGVVIVWKYALISGGGGGGSGDVVGPASSTDNAIVRFDGATGLLIQNSGITIADGASGTLSGTNTGDQSVFTTIAVAGQTSVVADLAADTLTLVAGTNITITTNAATDTITITASGGGGSGDVVGPAGATDNALCRFDGATGLLIQNSAVTCDDTTGKLTGARFGNTGLNVEDTDASHLLILKPGSNFTANRTLTITTGDADQTLSGTNTGDVTLAGTPDYITISGQVITRGLIDLTTDVTGLLPTANIVALASTFFGSGVDGALTFAAAGSTPMTANGTTVATRSGTTWTLARDVLASAITVDTGVTVRTANFRVFCNGTCTITGTVGMPGTVGGAGSGSTGGIAGANPVHAAGTYSAASAANNGGAGASGNNNGSNGQSNISTGYGSAGGAGGAVATKVAGTGGAGATAPTATQGTIHALPQTMEPRNLYSSTQWALGGGGGGGGPCDNASGSGGGGGGPGGDCFLAAKSLVIESGGVLSCKGGNGGNAGTTAGHAGGGGGGGGGLLVYMYSKLTNDGTITSAGGTGGSGFGTGAVGVDGTTGITLAIAMM